MVGLLWAAISRSRGDLFFAALVGISVLGAACQAPGDQGTLVDRDGGVPRVDGADGANVDAAGADSALADARGADADHADAGGADASRADAEGADAEGTDAGPAAPLRAQFVTQEVPTTMIAGAPHEVVIQMRNTGTVPWTDRIAIEFVARDAASLGAFGTIRASLAPDTLIAPEEVMTFRLTVTPDAAPGRYVFQCRMMEIDEPNTDAGAGGFDEPTPPVVVQVRDADLVVDFGAERYAPNFSANNVTRHTVFVDEPSWLSPAESYYDRLHGLGVRYQQLNVSGQAEPQPGTRTLAFDFMSPAPDAPLAFSKLDFLLDQILAQGLKPYLRLQQPGWMLRSYDRFDCSPSKIERLGDLYEAIVRHVVARYGEATTEWIFSFDNERGIDRIGCYALTGSIQCDRWERWNEGAEALSTYTDALAGRIKAVDSRLQVAAWESFPYYNWYLVRYLITNDLVNRLRFVDIVSAHDYVDFGEPHLSTPLALLRSDESAGPPVWSTTLGADGTTRAIFALLEQENLGRIALWAGENNLSADNTDLRDSGVDGGLYYALSALRNAESGMRGMVRWWDIGPEYGLFDWPSASGESNGVREWPLLDAAYAFIWLDRMGLNGRVRFHDISPDNSALRSSSSVLRAFAISTNQGDTLVVLNIGESEADVGVRILGRDGATRYTLEAYRYASEGAAESIEPRSDFDYAKSPGQMNFAAVFPPLSMSVLRISL